MKKISSGKGKTWDSKKAVSNWEKLFFIFFSLGEELSIEAAVKKYLLFEK